MWNNKGLKKRRGTRPDSESVTGHRPEDDGQDGDDDGSQKGDPERSAKEQLADVRFADADRAEGSLRGKEGAS